ncbi:MAG: hypothetical protein ACF8CY_05210, partial [Gimesia chilikensis]
MTDHRINRPFFQSLLVAITVLATSLASTEHLSAAPGPMTPQELQAFGKEIQQTAYSQDAAKFRALFDWTTFINRVLGVYEQNPAVKEAIQPVRKQLETAYSENNQGIDSEILAEVGSGADYRFLAMRKEDNQFKVI